MAKTAKSLPSKLLELCWTHYQWWWQLASVQVSFSHEGSPTLLPSSSLPCGPVACTRSLECNYLFNSQIGTIYVVHCICNMWLHSTWSPQISCCSKEFNLTTAQWGLNTPSCFIIQIWQSSTAKVIAWQFIPCVQFFYQLFETWFVNRTGGLLASQTVTAFVDCLCSLELRLNFLVLANDSIIVDCSLTLDLPAHFSVDMRLIVS